MRLPAPRGQTKMQRQNDIVPQVPLPLVSDFSLRWRYVVNQIAARWILPGGRPGLRSLPSRERSSCNSRFKNYIVIIELPSEFCQCSDLGVSYIEISVTGVVTEPILAGATLYGRSSVATKSLISEKCGRNRGLFGRCEDFR
jgi:hypothetical protein